jgi:uncharacterized membrane protein
MATKDVRTAQDQPGAGPRRVVATFERYEEAQAAVDRLADARFPVERVAIVARGLRLEEQVIGRETTGRAVAQGALSGALTGTLIGWLLGLFNAIEPLVSAFWLALYGLVIGALLGALFGALMHASTGGRRDFSAVSTLRAEHYDLLVDADVAGAAEELLGQPV